MYKILLERHPDIAYEFIDISIELDHFESIPEPKIIALGRKLDKTKNYFCKDLLCLMFILHVYQFYTDVIQIQRIASALGLEHLPSEPNVFLSQTKRLPRPKK